MFRFNFIRLAVSVSLVALIGSALPQSNGTAMAADSYNLGANSSAGDVLAGATIVLFGVGVIDGFGAKSTAAASSSVPTAGGAGGGATGAPPVINGEQPIYDVTGADPDLSAFYKDETALQDGGIPIGPTLSKDVLKGADQNKVHYTVFAPTDAAIGNIGPATVLSAINPQNSSGVISPQSLATASKVFAYHIIPGKVLSINDLKQLPGVTADPGAPLAALDGTNVYIKFIPGPTPSDLGVLQISNAPFGSPSDASKVVIATIRQTDEHASNGIVHPIDAALIPPSLASGG